MSFSRRDFLTAVATTSIGTAKFGFAIGAQFPCLRGASVLATARTDASADFLEAQRKALRIPGLAACLVKGGALVWSGGFGFADLARGVLMDPERSLLNIGSISKTLVATSVMQLWERGLFELDDDVNERLSFVLRNPFHPDRPITYRQLLTHHAAIADGPAYRTSYVRGDSPIALETWLRDYLCPEGKAFDKAANFHPWRPGSKREYSNVGFGVLGLLVERISGVSLPSYTKKHLFEPLGMTRTAWRLDDPSLDRADLAVPYYVKPADPNDKESAEEFAAYKTFHLIDDATKPQQDPTIGEVWPLALYGFPNYPDGALRTSVNQLARLLMAYLNQGAIGEARILQPETVRLMLTTQAATSPEQGLCWANRVRKADGIRLWGHNGGDPGIRTNLSFRLDAGVGVIVFANRADADLSAINDRLFVEAARF